MQTFTKRLPGLLLCALIALPAWLLGRAFPIVGSPVLGILFGMLIAFWRRPETLNPGIAYTSKKILQLSIILLGFDMNLFNVVQTGSQTIFLMLFTLTATFVTAYIVGKLLKVEGNTNILVAVGTAICGGSAIAATAPVIRARDEEVARAISTIFLFNVLAAFLFPILGHLLGMSDVQFGLWAGTAVNDTSSVVAAGYTFSDAAGDYAVIVKLTRTLMIIPITLALAFHTSRKQASGEATYSLSKIFPWFILGFVGASILTTFLPFPEVFTDFLVQISKFLIVMAMTAIGLNTNLVRLFKYGWRPILLGGICWFVLSVVSLSLQVFL